MALHIPIVHSGKLYCRYNESICKRMPDAQERETHHLLRMRSIDLIGREQEIAAVSTLLQRVDVRLLVITGPGGVGKTHLALQVAATLEKDFPDGICCVSLAALRNVDLVVPTIVQELGLIQADEKPLVFPCSQQLESGSVCQSTEMVSFFTRLEMHLHTKRFLLLLDNFEQVAGAASALTGLLMACPDLKILVTSREKLHLRIEHEFVVPPLPFPDGEQIQSVEQCASYAAVSLFVQRATAVKLDFQLTSANAHIVGEICRRLDGLPLAIELAAAFMKLLSPRALLARLEHPLQILTSRARDLPRRQQALSKNLAWSYDLLNKEEQTIFRLLSVVARSCTLEAAEDICYTVYPAFPNILEHIASLVDKSLLQRIEQIDGDVRLVMLETVRAYGREWLDRCGETEVAYQAHAAYYTTFAEGRAELELSTVSSSAISTLPDGLTPREGEVLRLLARGLTNAQIAEKLVISPNTVHAHSSSIYNKLAVSSRSAATRYALEHKLA